MSSRALVVHATDLLVKGYVAVSPDRGRGGTTNGLWGVTRVVREAIKFKDPEVAVAVLGALPRDAARGLIDQAERLPDLLRAHGVVVVEAPEHTIDVVASYVVAALQDGRDVVVAGSDKRLAQLVSPRVWWFDGYKRVRYTIDAVQKRFGVAPDEVAGWLALVGDRDSCPGVKGIGAKGAVDLIGAHGSVRAALEVAEALPGRTGKALRASLEEAWRQLAHAVLDTSAVLPRPWAELRWTAPDVASLDRLYAELGFFRWLASATPPLSWRVMEPADLVETLTQLRREVSIYPVIGDPSPPRGTLVGLALSAGKGEAVYVPLQGGVPVALVAWLEDEAVTKVGHDTKVARVALARKGVTLRGVVGDACLASHQLEPSGLAPHDLGPTAQAVLQRAVRHADEVRGRGAKRKGFEDLPDDVVGEFACHLAETSGVLWRHLAPDVNPRQMDEALALSETLVRMELRGMAVDVASLEATAVDWVAERAGLETTIYEHAGRSFGIGSTKQLGHVLFEELGLTVMARTKTGWSTKNAALERIVHEHPIVALVLRWRLLKRLQDTWITALVACVDPDGRVRSTFSPSRSFTGRLVNFAPDLGRVPGRTQDMARIREGFRAPPGRVILSVDYHQLGLHVLAHLSRDPALIEPLGRGADMHRETACALFDRTPAEVSYDERQVAKVVNFATFAGQGASALALQLGVEIEEAKRLIVKFDARYHVTRAYQEGELQLARTRGWIETLAGRRWPIHDLEARDPMTRQYAERLARRATHEASVADVGRAALVRSEAELLAAGVDAFPLVVVLDEVLFEVAEDELHRAAQVAASAMRGVYDLVVPLTVGCKAGPSWGELEVLT